VAAHLADLVAEAPDEILPSPRFRGGQRAADRAIEGLDVTGYSRNRNEAYPVGRRAASGLSPYIRHGLLTLARVWDAADGGPADDVERFRDELTWQEYARHWYARLGPATAHPVRHTYGRPLRPHPAPRPPWTEADEEMACLELTVGELEDDGWLVNQTRMWLASHWTVRQGRDWAAGEDYFFRHLLDGSRAANRLGWQWVTGVGSARAYGFSRWQVERRAPGLCASCELGADCPIDRWPDEPELVPLGPDRGDRRLAAQSADAAAAIAGPAEPIVPAPGAPAAEAVWLTAESLGDGDPALAANPGLPAVFVFDRPLLARLGLSAKRLVFLVETLAELATRRPVEVAIGDPVEILAGRSLAATHTPVPGWSRRSARLDLVEVHPWPWLLRPGTGPVSSHRAWLEGLEGGSTAG
jgi:deoxyribodipyrimidine photo-lyase